MIIQCTTECNAPIAPKLYMIHSHCYYICTLYIPSHIKITLGEKITITAQTRSKSHFLSLGIFEIIDKLLLCEAQDSVCGDNFRSCRVVEYTPESTCGAGIIGKLSFVQLLWNPNGVWQKIQIGKLKSKRRESEFEVIIPIMVIMPPAQQNRQLHLKKWYKTKRCLCRFWSYFTCL